jgi:hypothetical protein
MRGRPARRIVAACVVLGSWAAGAGTAGAATSSELGTRTSSAAAFRDSVGVATHPMYLSTSYGRWDQVVAKLRELGVYHMRGNVFRSADPAWNARHYAELTATAAAGLRLHLDVSRTCSFDGRLEPCLDAVRTRLPAGSVASLLWPDEHDVRGGPTWAADLSAWGRSLFAAVKADPVLSPLPVVGPGLARTESPALLGDQSAFLDLGSIRPSTGATSPRPGQLAGELRRIRAVSGDKPVIATAAGFHTAPGATDSDQPGTDEETAAVYTLRTVLEHYANGVQRTFLYELVDQWSDPASAAASYGLLRSDFSPKPSFTALKNLLAMAGTVGPVQVTGLPFEVTGTTSGLRSLVLQQADRTYLLALWRTASVWDRDARRPRAVTPRRLEVHVPGALTAALGDPMRGPGFAPARLSGERTTVEVGADPVLLRLTTREPGGEPGAASALVGAGQAGAGTPRRARDRTKPRLTRLRVRRSGRRYVLTFRLSERATVRGRLDRGRRDSRRYRRVKAISTKRLKAGSRRVVLGRLKPGRFRLRVQARDVAGNKGKVARKAFKARSRRAAAVRRAAR